MANAIDLSTIGIRMGFAFETTAGTKPSAFTNIRNPKNIPDMSPEPNGIDVTSLNDLEYMRYIKGLKDLGGSLGFTLSMSKATLAEWNAMVTNSETKKASGLATWFVLYHPDLDDSFFFTGDPSSLGFPSADVNSAWEATVYIAPTGGFTWDTAINPTDPVSA